MTQVPLKQVVVCADDYALNAPISQGIVSLARRGRISATSVMSLSPRWSEDAAALRELQGQLDVGLHLDWTSPFARQAGHGSSLAGVMARALLHSYRGEVVQDLIERQLDAFEQHWQAAPAHIDGHQHIHQFAVLREALAEVVMRRYGTCATRPWLRIAQVAQGGWKANIISLMGARALQGWAQRNRWPTVSPLLGVYDFEGNLADYARHMQDWLTRLPTQTCALLMCHPARSAQVDDAIGAARKREFAYLASPDFVRHLRDARVQLVRGRDTLISQSDGSL